MDRAPTLPDLLLSHPEHAKLDVKKYVPVDVHDTGNCDSVIMMVERFKGTQKESAFDASSRTLRLRPISLSRAVQPVSVRMPRAAKGNLSMYQIKGAFELQVDNLVKNARTCKNKARCSHSAEVVRW